MATNSAKTAVVTGATSGLGEAAAVALAKEGYRVLAVGRDPERGAAVVARAKAEGGEVELLSADLFSLADVRRLGREIKARTARVDLLVNNAGGTFGKTALTVDGLERTFALNVAAPFVLTAELAPTLSAAKGRVVNIVTGVKDNVTTSIEKLTGAEAAAGIGSYVQNKLALIALTQEQQRRYAGRGITVVCLHPGIIPNTNFGQDMPAFLRKMGGAMAKIFRFGSTFEQAAERYLAAGTGPVEPAGFYWEGKLHAAPKQALDAAFGAALWGELEKVTSRGRAVASAAQAVAAA